MTAPSNETLDYKFQSMEKQNASEHKEIKTILVDIQKEVKGMDKKFVTRLEFKAVSAIIGIVAVLLGIISFFISV